jgi:hypothetical protein
MFAALGPVIKRRVRSDRVVVLSPLLDNDLGFFQAVEDFSVEQRGRCLLQRVSPSVAISGHSFLHRACPLCG